MTKKQIYKVTEKNGSMVTLQDITDDELFKNITFVKRVNITDQEEDQEISIQEEINLPQTKMQNNLLLKFFKRRGTVMIGHCVIILRTFWSSFCYHLLF